MTEESPLKEEFLIGVRIRGYARWIPRQASYIREEKNERYEIHKIVGNPLAKIEKGIDSNKIEQIKKLEWFTLLRSKGLKFRSAVGSLLFGDKRKDAKIILVYVNKMRGRKEKVQYTGAHHGCTAVYEQRSAPFWALLAYAENPLGRLYRVTKEVKIAKKKYSSKLKN